MQSYSTVTSTPHLTQMSGGSEDGGRCILSLDGGGVRGLSTLYILKNLMERINAKAKNDPPLKPCDYFDIIAGTSTGGLIAVMLGRLKMSVEQCIEAYMTLSEEIFKPGRIYIPFDLRGNTKARFDHTVLENCIKSVVKSAHLDEDSLMQEPSDCPCKVFICAVPQKAMQMLPFTNYQRVIGDNFAYQYTKVWEACRATTAAPTFFDPMDITLGPKGRSQRTLKFIDGGLGHNNPIVDVWNEANILWGGPDKPLLPQLRCVISIGAGGSEVDFGPGLIDVANRLREIATETETTADKFYIDHLHDLVHYGRYYRFNVKELDRIGLEEAQKLDDIMLKTLTYLNRGEVFREYTKCVKIMSEKEWTYHQALALKWLSNHNCLIVNENLRNHQISGIGAQPTSFREITDWEERNSPNRLLWISGSQGSGKSILSSRIYDHLTALHLNGKIAICHGASDYHHSDSLESIIGCLVRQLIHQNSEAANLFFRNFSMDQSLHISRMDLLDEVFETAMNKINAYFVINPKCTADIYAGLYSYLSRFWKKFSLRVLITSDQPVSHICCSPTDEIQCMNIFAKDDDLAAFTNLSISGNSTLSNIFNGNRPFREEMVKKITESSRKRFSAADMYLRSLQYATTPKQVRKVLQCDPDCPDSLLAASLAVIEQYPEHMKKLSQQALIYVITACRPMKEEELIQALAIYREDECLQDENTPSSSLLLDLCLGLISVKESSVCMSKYDEASTRYLRKKLEEWSTLPSLRTLASICVQFLSFSDFNTGANESKHQFSVRLKRYPFLAYAACYWHDHLRSNQMAEDLPSLRFFLSPTLLACAAQVASNVPFNQDNELRTFDQPVSGLHEAVKWGLTSVVSQIPVADMETFTHIDDTLEARPSFDVQDVEGQTPLHLAVRNQDFQIVDMLLANGFDVNKIDNKGKTPFTLAAEEGNIDIVDLCIEQHPQLVRDGYPKRYSALHYAFRGSEPWIPPNYDMIDAILTYSLSHRWEQFHEFSGELLLISLARWESDLVQRVLDHINIQVVRDACQVFEVRDQRTLDERSAIQLMRNLQENDNVFMTQRIDISHETLLHIMANKGNNNAVRTLLFHGANPNAQRLDPTDGKDKPLHLAVQMGHFECAVLLLDNGADVNSINEHYETPLMMAAHRGDLRMIRTLVQYGATINAKDYFGTSVIDFAREPTVRSLLLSLL